MQNDVGVFVQPTAAAVRTALSYSGHDQTSGPQLNFAPGDADAYNPSTYSYAVVRTGAGGIDPSKGSALAEFLNYAVSRGQLQAEGLGYVPLPQNLIDRALDLIAGIAGAPARPQFDYAAAAAEPPGGGNGSGGRGIPTPPDGGSEPPSPLTISPPSFDFGRVVGPRTMTGEGTLTADRTTRVSMDALTSPCRRVRAAGSTSPSAPPRYRPAAPKGATTARSM